MEPMNTPHERPGMPPHPHHGPMMRQWWDWRSPVGIGIFLMTSAVALFVLANLLISIVSALRPAPSFDSSALEQQLQQQSAVPAPSGSAASAPTTGAPVAQ